MQQRRTVYRHSVATRITHWLFFLAFMALVSSGLQIFNAASFLDASDRTDVHRRVLAVRRRGHDDCSRIHLPDDRRAWLDDGRHGRMGAARVSVVADDPCVSI